MRAISIADRAAFSGTQGVDLANHLVNASGLRVAPDRRRGRGSGVNPSGRFEPFARGPVDDGWSTLEDLPALKTEVQAETARTIITTNASPDISFDRSANPYRGCEHGCVYCFARPSHAYLGLSPGLDFETRLFVKPNAASLLAEEIARPGYVVKPLAIGTNTDPYQPIERRETLMRAMLEVLEAANHPVGIVTKSALVLRDLDILSRMAAKGLARVALSVTTLDRTLARAMEPRASTPTKRLEAVRALSEAGVPTMVMTAPIIPGLTDHEIERLLEAAKAAGARDVGYVLLRLPLEVAPLFKEWLLRHYPGRYRHVLSLLRSMRGGKDYDADWGRRMTGTGAYAMQIRRRFELAADRLELNRGRAPLRTDLFSPPKASAAGVQLSLL
ncbi:PA0069 family radical SAM protein [Antarcticirhabdus aurantiaca]|uniref:PA0069 family radical SAM protein n=1 Tax=Antarcticirhabdus aurantiaca TaxID=2606717 RepID=A0ACD4NSX4_9HYPH|nr:PA0069 family radical SAM protein [Antarcticirhabdus aurantiaca]WAJ29772.1 PA0069 family radical SAM protein [Jeongeuplla avenae]